MITAVSAPIPPGQTPVPDAPAPLVPPNGYAVPLPAYPQQLVRCRFCGCVPAAEVTFRGHRGMLIMMQFLHVSGPFCRDCGLAAFRNMTARTLIQGWYGYASSVITPITVLINLARRGAVANLSAPVPPPDGPSRRPADPGPPLLARPTAVIGLAIPVVVVLLIALVVATSPS